MKTKLKSVELFSGAGGLALGLAAAGFEHLAMIERDKNSIATARHNLSLFHGQGLRLLHQDVREIDYAQWRGVADVVAGGPPCQPFSLGGKHAADQDGRDMFPEAIRAVREIQPQAFVFENVKGLLRPSFADYFGYIVAQLQYPSLQRRVGDSWQNHYRLLLEGALQGSPELQYDVAVQLFNTADYGVPQQRHRVLILGIRKDLGIQPSFPSPTHSSEQLFKAQFVTKSYWERHGIAPTFSLPTMPGTVGNRTFRAPIAGLLPWKTVRDALCDLPDPRIGIDAISNHDFRAGARIYPGHIGSFIDEPSKAIKAGAHGVPGGENMMRFPDGSVRYYTVRESARIQTFPDEFVFQSTWGEAMRQIGNAVPVLFAQKIGSHLLSLISHSHPQEIGERAYTVAAAV